MAIKSSVVSISTNLLDRFPKTDFYVNTSYNSCGDKTRPEREVLKLPDAYENQSDEPQLELICTVYNINPGNNEDLKKRSQTLREYMIYLV